MSIDRSNSSDRRPNAKLAIYLSVDPKSWENVQTRSRTRATHSLHNKHETNTKCFAFPFHSELDLMITWRTFASFPSRKNTKYGHGSIETGLDIRPTDSPPIMIAVCRWWWGRFEFATRGLRKKAHMLLHTAHTATTGFRGNSFHSITLTPNSTAISILSRKTLRLAGSPKSGRGRSKVFRLSHETFSISLALSTLCNFLSICSITIGNGGRVMIIIRSLRPVPITELGQSAKLLTVDCVFCFSNSSFSSLTRCS
jgi:hypothetical protein